MVRRQVRCLSLLFCGNKRASLRRVLIIAKVRGGPRITFSAAQSKQRNEQRKNNRPLSLSLFLRLTLSAAV